MVRESRSANAPMQHGRHDHQRDGGGAVRGAHGCPSRSIIGRPRRSRARCARPAGRKPGADDEHRVARPRRAAPRAAGARRTCTSASSGSASEQQRQAAEQHREDEQDPDAPAAAGCGPASACRPRRRSSARRSPRLTGRRGRAAGRPGARRDDAHPPRGCSVTPSSRPGRARRTSMSRSSRVCRRLTGSSSSPTRTVPRPRRTRTSSMWASATRWRRWMRTKPAAAHCSSRVAQRHPHQVARRRRCAAARSRRAPRRSVTSLRVTKRVTPPSSTAIVSSAPGSPAAPACPSRLDHPADRLGESLGPHRLEQVVGGAQVERVDRVLVVGGDEHDLRRRPEAGQHPGDVEAVQPRHPDVEEERVDRLAPPAPAAPRRRRPRPARARPGRAGRAGSASSSRAGASSSATRTRRPARRVSRVHARAVLRHPHADLGAGARRGLDDQAVVVAVDLAQPLVDVAEPDAVAVGLTGERPPHRVGVDAGAVVLDADQRLLRRRRGRRS